MQHVPSKHLGKYCGYEYIFKCIDIIVPIDILRASQILLILKANDSDLYQSASHYNTTV
jgi:hypothetical protein